MSKIRLSPEAQELLGQRDQLLEKNKQITQERDSARAACAAHHDAWHALKESLIATANTGREEWIGVFRDGIAKYEPDDEIGKGWRSPEDYAKLEAEHDQEIGDFQEEVRNLVIRLSGAPDNSIDGAGSDAGWEEFTLSEIGQGFAFLNERLSKLEAEAAAMREAIRKLIAAAPHSGEGEQRAMACLEARQLLDSTTAGQSLLDRIANRQETIRGLEHETEMWEEHMSPFTEYEGDEAPWIIMKGEIEARDHRIATLERENRILRDKAGPNTFVKHPMP